MKSKFGISLFPWGDPPPKVSDLAQLTERAEDLGFDVHITSHFLLPPSLEQKFGNKYVLDSNLIIAAIANSTESVRMGLTCIAPLLHPLMWAKTLSTLDNITRGRLIPEIAVGWWEPEFQALGIDIRKRGAMTNEQIEIMKKLWTEDETTYDGKFYHLERVRLEPKPVQTPHPPIWIACGESPNFMPAVKRTAKYGDVWFPIWPTVEEVKRYFPKLKEECERVGRKAKMAIFAYAATARDKETVDNIHFPKLVREPWFKSREQVEKVCIVGTPEQCAERIEQYLKAGVSYFVLDLQYHGGVPTSYAFEQMEMFANEIIPCL